MIELPQPPTNVDTSDFAWKRWFELVYKNIRTRTPYVNVKDYGAAGDGIRDDGGAIQAAYDSISAAGGIIFFPPGTYLVKSTFGTWTKGLIKLVGSGYYSSQILTDHATADIFTFSATGVEVSGLYFNSSVTRTGGSYLKFTGSNVAAANCRFNKYYWGIHTTATIADYTNLGFTNGTASTGIGIRIEGGFDVSVRSVVMDAPNGSQPSSGIWVSNVGDLTVQDTNVIHHNNDMVFAPGNGEVVSSVYVSESFFDTAVRGFLVQPTGTGAVVRSRFTDCWFSSHTSEGVSILGGGSTVIDGLEFIGCHFFLNTSHGLSVSGAAENTRVLGGAAAQNGGSGFYFSSTSNFSVIGAISGAYGGLNGNTSYGVNIASTTCDNWQVTNCDLTGNTAGAINNAATTTNWNLGNILGADGIVSLRNLEIRGELSNSTPNSRMRFRSTVSNGNTIASVVPNGTATLSAWQCFNNSDLTAAQAAFDCRINNTTAQLTTAAVNAGTVVPLQTSINGNISQIWFTNGDTQSGLSVATNATAGFHYIPSCAGTPTGVPTTRTGWIPLVYDRTNNILYAYSNGAWRAH